MQERPPTVHRHFDHMKREVVTLKRSASFLQERGGTFSVVAPQFGMSVVGILCRAKSEMFHLQ